MKSTQDLYSSSLALLTDLYQITMAAGYWKGGRADQQAVFHMFFRKCPFRSGYAIAAGLETFLEFVEAFHFTADDIEYLRSIQGNDGHALFEEDFLRYLSELKLDIDVDAIPEGTVVMPHEPLVRIRGSILQAQLLETALLNIINFQTLIATKSARVCRAARGEPVLEFGLRRAQGIDGSLSASRAAHIGGCAATSNVLAGKLFGIPVRGTHAHSWVMSFDSELEAFREYSIAMPNNCVFLVDTYDTLEGVRNAIRIGQQLRTTGHKLVGIRLDSGDLAGLSIEARKLLDAAGFTDAAIVASNDLDEHSIENLKSQGAQIQVWGVGTKLVTAYDQPALGGVYKLGAIRQPGGDWIPKVKLSEQLVKTSIPGILQVRRFYRENLAFADMIYNELAPPQSNQTSLINPLDVTRKTRLTDADVYDDLLQSVLRSGQRVAPVRSLTELRSHCQRQLSIFHDSTVRLENPQVYPVGLESGLYDLKSTLVQSSQTTGQV